MGPHRPGQKAVSTTGKQGVDSCKGVKSSDLGGRKINFSFWVKTRLAELNRRQESRVEAAASVDESMSQPDEEVKEAEQAVLVVWAWGEDAFTPWPDMRCVRETPFMYQGEGDIELLWELC